MSMNRHLLRAIAPATLLLLAACSDKAQVANTTQEVMDAKNPGVIGAIKNATGTGIGDKEINAAINASEVIPAILQSRQAEEEALAAAAKDDAKTAEAKIAAAQKARPKNEYLDITALGIALQCGEDPKTIADRTSKVANGAEYRSSSYLDDDVPASPGKSQGFLYLAANNVEQVLQNLKNMNLSRKEMRRRQAATAGTLVDLHSRLADLFERAGETDRREYELREVTKYRQMQQELQAQVAGEL